MFRFSMFIQNQQFNSNLGTTISKLLKNTDSINFYISKYNFSWDSITDFTTPLKALSEDEQEDILFKQNLSSVNQLNKILIELEPALHFWFDTDNIGYINNGSIVSLNLLDVCYNSYNQLSLKDSSHYFMEEAINNSLVSRYLEQGECSDQISRQVSDRLEGNDYLQIFKNRIIYS